MCIFHIKLGLKCCKSGVNQHQFLITARMHLAECLSDVEEEKNPNSPMCSLEIWKSHSPVVCCVKCYSGQRFSCTIKNGSLFVQSEHLTKQQKTFFPHSWACCVPHYTYLQEPQQWCLSLWRATLSLLAPLPQKNPVFSHGAVNNNRTWWLQTISVCQGQQSLLGSMALQLMLFGTQLIPLSSGILQHSAAPAYLAVKEVFTHFPQSRTRVDSCWQCCEPQGTHSQQLFSHLH